MRNFPIYQVDAFTDRLFAGNPAAVVPLDAWLPDAGMQACAAENNLAETAYLVPAGPARWELRWFTPAIEVPLCGHATLASAFVLTEVLGETAGTLSFVTRQSGELTGDPRRRRLVCDAGFRCGARQGVVAPERVAEALGARCPREVVEFDAVGTTMSWLAVLRQTKRRSRALDPDMRVARRVLPAAQRHRDGRWRSGGRAGPARLRLAHVRAEGGDRRGPGHRLRPLLAGAVLGRKAGQDASSSRGRCPEARR